MATRNFAENPGSDYNTFEQPPPYTGPNEYQPPSNQYHPAPPSYPQATGQHHTNIITIVRRPPVIGGVIINQKPNNHLAFSIINFLFCCMCFGIAAIVYSLKVDSEYAAGRVQAATAASRIARRLNLLGLAFGILIYMLASVAIIVPVVITIDSDDDYYDD